MQQQTGDSGTTRAADVGDWRAIYADEIRRRLAEKLLPTPEFVLPADGHISLDSRKAQHDRDQEMLVWLLEHPWTHTVTIQFGEYFSETEGSRRGNSVVNWVRRRLAGKTARIGKFEFQETTPDGKSHAHWLLDIPEKAWAQNALTPTGWQIAATERCYEKLFSNHREKAPLSLAMKALSCEATSWMKERGLGNGTVQIAEIRDQHKTHLLAYVGKSFGRLHRTVP